MDDTTVVDTCGAADNGQYEIGLHIGAIFVILATSSFGALSPVAARRLKFFKCPKSVYAFAKYFGSGVIIATAFIHLLAPAFESLTDDCLTGVWEIYPWASAISMMAVFLIFFVELLAYRIGTAYFEKRRLKAYDPHGHDVENGAHNTHGPHLPTPAIEQEEVIVVPTE